VRKWLERYAVELLVLAVILLLVASLVLPQVWHAGEHQRWLDTTVVCPRCHGTGRVETRPAQQDTMQRGTPCP